MKLIDLSHTVFTDMPAYPGDETRTVIERLADHGEGTHRLSAFAMGCHVGTHIDLPLHFRDGEPALDALPPEACFGRARVLSAPQGAIGPDVFATADLTSLDFVILRTGWDRRWGTAAYYETWPWLTPETATLLAGAGLRGIGLDNPSVDPIDIHISHEILAAAGMINVENLTNLDRLPDEPFLFMALPLRLAGAEASPVRAVATL